MKSRVFSLRPAPDEIPPNGRPVSPPCGPRPPPGHLVAILVLGSGHPVTVPVFESPRFYLTMAPKCESSDVDKPERSQKVLPLRGKVSTVQ